MAVASARDFKFDKCVDRYDYCRMHVKTPQYGVYSWSLDLLKFWEISTRPNISETVQDIPCVPKNEPLTFCNNNRKSAPI